MLKKKRKNQKTVFGTGKLKLYLQIRFKNTLKTVQKPSDIIFLETNFFLSLKIPTIFKQICFKIIMKL